MKSYNTTNVGVININNIFITSPANYKNGNFVAVFCPELKAISCCPNLHPATFRVLNYLLASIIEGNKLEVSLDKMKQELPLSPATIWRALKDLTEANILCRIEGAPHNRYTFTDRLINPRLAIRGNTRQLNKDAMPSIMLPYGQCFICPGETEFRPNEDFEVGL